MGSQGDVREFFRGPAFRLPAGAGADGEPGARQAGELIKDRAILGGNGEFGGTTGEIRQDCFGDAPIALPGGDVVARMGEQGGAKGGGAFTGGFEPDAVAGASGGRHKSGANKTLQINDEIETVLMKSAEQMPPVGGATLTVKGDALVDVRVIFEQIRKIRVDDPTDVGVGKALAQGGEDRQRLEDIAEGARLDDADAFG